MLVLSRKPGEQLIINGNITITVIAVGAGRIRLGIDAPREIPVLRGELSAKREWEAIPEPVACPDEYASELDWPLIDTSDFSPDMPTVGAGY